jgi:hypothetical protein
MMTQTTDLVQLVVDKTEAGRLRWQVSTKPVPDRSFDGALGIGWVIVAEAPLALSDGRDGRIRFRFPKPEAVRLAPSSMEGLVLEVTTPESESRVPMTREQAVRLSGAIVGQGDRAEGEVAEALKSL